MQRKENGVAIFNNNFGQPVVALDAIAKIAGVGPRAVAKVFAALELVAADTHAPLADLVRLDYAPLAAPNANRADATNDYWKSFVARMQMREAAEEHVKFLRLTSRDRQHRNN